MVKKFELWNSEITPEDWRDIALEDHEEHPEYWQDKDFENRLWDFAADMNELDLDDLRTNLDIQLDTPILILADIGRWDGRVRGYKEIYSGNLKDIFCAQVNGMSDQHWFCDGYNICCQETHHDGTNYYIYRAIRNKDNIEGLYEKILNQEEVTSFTLNYYTKSLAGVVAKIFGF